jgi:hypothetical protein
VVGRGLIWDRAGGREGEERERGERLLPCVDVMTQCGIIIDQTGHVGTARNGRWEPCHRTDQGDTDARDPSLNVPRGWDCPWRKVDQGLRGTIKTGVDCVCGTYLPCSATHTVYGERHAARLPSRSWECGTISFSHRMHRSHRRKDHRESNPHHCSEFSDMIDLDLAISISHRRVRSDSIHRVQCTLGTWYRQLCTLGGQVLSS